MCKAGVIIRCDYTNTGTRHPKRVLLHFMNPRILADVY